MGANILIVEDEEPLTMLLRYNLEAEGYEVGRRRARRRGRYSSSRKTPPISP